MFQAFADLISGSPMSQSRPIAELRAKDEGPEDFDKRTWAQHLHQAPDGVVFLPAPAVKIALYDCAKLLGEKVKGKGQSTYTKHFEAGVMAVGDFALTDHQGEPILATHVQAERLFLNADGVKGSGKRCWRLYPVIPEWKTRVTILVFDMIINPEKLEEYLRHAGKMIGFGRWRPRNGGQYGRFTVQNFKVEELKATA